MLKRILLALDVTPASLCARRHALDLATRQRAAVTGLVLIDPQLVTPAEATPMGTTSYKEHKDSVVLQKARADADVVASRFSADCRANGVSSDAQVVTDSALKALITESDVCDLIAIGVDCAFDAASPHKISPVVTGLLQDNSRPVLAAPSHEETAIGLRTFVA